MAIEKLLALVVTVTALSVFAQSAHAQERDLAITNATLIDGTGAPPQPGVTILVRGGVITTILDADEAMIPDGAEILDAAGKYVIPGLADLHVHFGTGGLVPSDSLTVDRVLRQFLFYGVTTVLNLGATNGSLDEILVLRRRAVDGALLAPQVYATGGLLTVPGSHPIATIMDLPEGADPEAYDWSTRGVWVVRTPAEVRAVVARLSDAGMDGVKVVIESGPGPFGDDHPQMPPALVQAAVEEANRHGLSVFTHATSVDELEVAVEAGVHAVVHLVGSEPVPPDLLTAMREQGVYYVPTLSVTVWADAWGDPEDTLTDPFLRSGVEARVLESLRASPMAPAAPPTDDDWAWRRQQLGALKAAFDAGVPIAAGSDTNNPFVFPGYSMHHELALMVESGLTPMQALVAATREAAKLFGEADRWGTIEPGRRADLLILAANPLEDIRNTQTLKTVVLSGEVLDRSALLPPE